MRVVLQRASSASVTIDGTVRGRIDRGLVVFVGIEGDDTAADSEWLARKIVRMRLFEEDSAPMSRSLQDIGGGILLISQFTLHASTQKGTRPSFHRAARPEHAQPLYHQFILDLGRELGRPVATGEFGAMMQVALVNDGPVTILMDSRNRD